MCAIFIHPGHRFFVRRRGMRQVTNPSTPWGLEGQSFRFADDFFPHATPRQPFQPIADHQESKNRFREGAQTAEMSPADKHKPAFGRIWG